MSDKGYKKPPLHSRFKKGQSGNPGGRRKGSLNIKTILKAIAEVKADISEKGKTRPAPLLEALLLQQAQCGLKGDWRATDSLLDRYERHFPDQPESERELPEEDAQMLDRFLDRRSSPPSSPDEPPDDD